MDLAVILPLSVLFCLQSLLSLLLLSPRALSKHIAGLLSLTYTNKVVNAVMHTVAVAISAMTISSLVQLLGVLASLNKAHHGDRALALTVEELRALLAVVLGISNIVLLFVNRTTAAEQLAHDKAKLNLSVLQKQAKGFTAEYNRATAAAKAGDSAGSGDGGKSLVDKLVQEKQALLVSVDEALQAKKTAEAKMEALLVQSKGLEREYDRLLSENDGLKRQLARMDTRFSGSGDKKSD